jgi:hypothetical protein
LPRRLHNFVLDRCSDSNVPHQPGEDPDPAGEFIIGLGWIIFDSVWSPLYSMNDEKRAM